IGLGVGEDMLAYPRHRQIGKDFLAIAQALEGNGGFRGKDDVVESQNDAFGPPGRTRGIQYDCGVAASALGDFVAEETRMKAAELPSALLHGRVIVQKSLVVVPQAARVRKDHGLQKRAALFDRQKLVDL